MKRFFNLDTGAGTGGGEAAAATGEAATGAVEGAPGGGGAPAASVLDTPAAASADWMSGLDNDQRATLGDKFKSPADLAKAYVELNRWRGAQNKVVVPKDGATPEDIAAFHRGIGVPDAPAGYGFELPEGADRTLTDSFAEIAHKAGVPKGAAAQLFEWFNGQTANAIQAQQEAAQRQVETTIDALKGEWGGNFDTKLAQAKLAEKEFFNEATRQLITSSGLGRDAEFVKSMANIGKAIGEDPLIGERNGISIGINSPEAAKVELGRLRMDSAFQAALTDARNPGHKEAVERQWGLQMKAAAGTPE